MSQKQQQGIASDPGDGAAASRDLIRLISAGRSFSGRERHCGFLNTRDGGFADISAVSGIDFPDDGRAVGVTDWDHDGDLDLWIANRSSPQVRFLRNNVQGRRYVSFRLRGTNSNRDAVGARVELQIINRTGKQERLVRSLRAGDAFLSQSSKWVHFGLGDDSQVQRLVVHWPGGEEEEFPAVPTDSRYLLVEGRGRADPWEKPARQVQLEPSPTKAPRPSDQARVVLADPVPLPILDFAQMESPAVRRTVDRGDLVLVNLWASWCLPCLKELRELSEHRQELSARDVRVIALCVDDLNEKDARDTDKAIKFVASLDSSFLFGLADPDLVMQLQLLHDSVISRHRDLPLPSSFLVDRLGRAAVIYKGSVSVERLLADVDLLESSRSARHQRAAPLVGRWNQDPSPADLVKIGRRFRDAGRLKDAVVYYRHALGRSSQEFMAHFSLAAALFELDDPDGAIEHYEAAGRLRPRDARVRHNLAVVYASRDDLPHTLEYLKQAVALDPDHAASHAKLGELFAQAKNLVMAIEHYEQAVRLRGDDPILRDALGAVLAQQNEFKRASVQFEAAVRLDPENVAVRDRLARALALAGELRAAAVQLREVLRRDPDFENARENLERVEAEIEER